MKVLVTAVALLLTAAGAEAAPMMCLKVTDSVCTMTGCESKPADASEYFMLFDPEEGTLAVCKQEDGTCSEPQSLNFTVTDIRNVPTGHFAKGHNSYYYDSEARILTSAYSTTASGKASALAQFYTCTAMPKTTSG